MGGFDKWAAEGRFVTTEVPMYVRPSTRAKLKMK